MSSTLRVAVRETRSAARTPRAYLSRLVEVRRPRLRPPVRSTRKRIFSLDLHAAGTAAVRGGFEELGIELVQWMIGDPKHVARDRPEFPVADPVAHVNRHSWTDLSDRRVHAFWARYGDYLRQFDGFLVNHASALARLFLPSGRPVLVHNTSRYECPYTTDPTLWTSLNAELIRGVNDGQVFPVSNNKADADYLYTYTGIASRVMPSVTDYAQGRWTMEREDLALSTISPQLEHDMTRRLGAVVRPMREIFPRGYSYSQLFALGGVVLVPYQVSTMFMFEIMNAGMPLHVPSDRLLDEWFNSYSGVLSQLSYLQVHGLSTGTRPKGDLNRICDPEVRQWWLDRADFGSALNYPLATRFDSVEELFEVVSRRPDPGLREATSAWAVTNREMRNEILSDFSDLI